MLSLKIRKKVVSAVVACVVANFFFLPMVLTDET